MRRRHSFPLKDEKKTEAGLQNTEIQPMDRSSGHRSRDLKQGNLNSDLSGFPHTCCCRSWMSPSESSSPRCGEDHIHIVIARWPRFPPLCSFFPQDLKAAQLPAGIPSSSLSSTKTRLHPGAESMLDISIVSALQTNELCVKDGITHSAGGF